MQRPQTTISRKAGRHARASRMRWCNNKVYMKASIKLANMTPPSLLTLSPTAGLTRQSLDAGVPSLSRNISIGTLSQANKHQKRKKKPPFFVTLVEREWEDFFFNYLLNEACFYPPALYADEGQAQERKRTSARRGECN